MVVTEQARAKIAEVLLKKGHNQDLTDLLTRGYKGESAYLDWMIRIVQENQGSQLLTPRRSKSA